MEQSLSLEAKSRSACQEFTCLLRFPKVHHCVYKRPPLVPDEFSPRP